MDGTIGNFVAVLLLRMADRFGSNYCNDANSGWILSYNPTSLAQLNVFNTSPDWGLTSIWQGGVGLAADEGGSIYAETAETGTHGYDVPNGGQTYCNSVLQLNSDLDLTDYFTPWSVAFLNAHDLDMSSTGAVVLPDQPEAPSSIAHHLPPQGARAAAGLIADF